MIFPQLPRRIVYEHTVRDPVSKVDSVQSVGNVHSVHSVQAPLRPLSADHGFEQQGYSTGPAAGFLKKRSHEPIDWTSRGSWEFYMLVCALVFWMGYWNGVHRGLW